MRFRDVAQSFVITFRGGHTPLVVGDDTVQLAADDAGLCRAHAA